MIDLKQITMISFRLKFFTALILASSAVLVVAIFAASGEPVSLAQTATTPTPAMPPKMGSGSDWILLNNVPPGSPQIVYGAEIYRLVCSACHGDKGQGLTTEWRMTWAPEDQNCWKSKCHALNHPPEGFVLPIAPSLTNLTGEARFPTALELEKFIRQYMPWQDPGSLTDERAWQVTSYVLKLNNVAAGPEINPETAVKIRLAPETGAASSGEATTQAAVASPAPSSAPLFVAVAFVVILMSAGAVWWWRKGRRSTGASPRNE